MSKKWIWKSLKETWDIESQQEIWEKKANYEAKVKSIVHDEITCEAI
jgi:hypothetical protein